MSEMTGCVKHAICVHEMLAISLDEINHVWVAQLPLTSPKTTFIRNA